MTDSGAAAAHRTAYVARINRVVDHVQAHLGEPLDLQTLASVAHFSPWHFHRVFQAMTGETVADHVRRRRLESAAWRLLATPPASALSVALDVGFASAEVFSRGFRSHFGMTPTGWRRGGWRSWRDERHAQMRKIHQGLRKAHQAVIDAFLEDDRHWPKRRAQPPKGDPMKVEVRTLPQKRVAYMRRTGPYGTPEIGQTWQRFMRWAASQGFMDGKRNFYGISQDNPEITPPEKCRYDCCVEVDGNFAPQRDIGVETVAGGKYACASFTGTGATIHQAWMQVYGEWLPDSGYQAGDEPALELYEPGFDMDEKTGEFTCLLCLPVK